MKTEYYGAEIQNVQIQIAIRRDLESDVIYSFSQKVLADTYIVKSTQPAGSSIKALTTTAELNYTPIMLQLGQGGPNINDPVAYVRSAYSSYNVTYNGTDAKYDAYNLNKVKALTNITSSPAADLIEVTATYSLVISANIIILVATPK